MAALMPLPLSWRREAGCDATLQCMASFFAGPLPARDVLLQLRLQHGLQADQCLLLGPLHASRLQFAVQARVWRPQHRPATRPLLADPAPMALLGGLLVGMLTVVGLFMDLLPDGEQALPWLLAPLGGALAGWLAAVLACGALSQRPFNRTVRSQLMAGHWVVLVHRLHRRQQESVGAMMRNSGLGWCAMAAPWRTL